MRTIWKYTLASHCSLSIPAGAQLLSVKTQGCDICAWFLLDDAKSERQERHFRIYGTGHKVSDETLRFIDTVMLDEGSLVLHVFEVIPVYGAVAH